LGIRGLPVSVALAVGVSHRRPTRHKHKRNERRDTPEADSPLQRTVGAMCLLGQACFRRDMLGGPDRITAAHHAATRAGAGGGRSPSGGARWRPLHTGFRRRPPRRVRATGAPHTAGTAHWGRRRGRRAFGNAIGSDSGVRWARRLLRPLARLAATDDRNGARAAAAAAVRGGDVGATPAHGGREGGAASAPPRGRPPNRGDHPPAARHNRAQRIGRAEPFDACAVTRARRTPRRPLDARRAPSHTPDVKPNQQH
ncbi:hypothetical protein HPB47_002085, partial [Ixodes persulcatus]